MSFVGRSILYYEWAFRVVFFWGYKFNAQYVSQLNIQFSQIKKQQKSIYEGAQKYYCAPNYPQYYCAPQIATCYEAISLRLKHMFHTTVYMTTCWATNPSPIMNLVFLLQTQFLLLEVMTSQNQKIREPYLGFLEFNSCMTWQDMELHVAYGLFYSIM